MCNIHFGEDSLFSSLLLPQFFLDPDLPVFNPLPDQGLQGGDVNNLNKMVIKKKKKTSDIINDR